VAAAEPWRLTLVQLTASGRFEVITNAPINYGDAYAQSLTNYLMVARVPPLGTSFASNAPAWPMQPPYRVDHWKAGHGLPSNRVRTLKQTRDGYLWLGTLHGLARFDGVRFTVFTAANTPALAATSDDMRCLAEDSEGNLWLGTANGLVRYRVGRFDTFSHEPLVSGQRILALAATTGNQLWVGTENGLARLRDGVVESGPKTPFEGEAVYSVTEDRTGRLWVVFRLATARLEPVTGQWEEVRREADRPFYNNLVVCSAQEGRAWFGGHGVYGWQEGQVQPALVGPAWVDGVPYSDNPIWHMAEDSTGSLWFTMGYGADNLYRVQGQEVVRLSSGEWSVNDARCLEPDREGNLWVGTYASGLTRMQTLPVVTFHFGARTPFAKVRTVTEAQDGSVWLGTEGGPVHWSGKAITAFCFTNVQPAPLTLPVIVLRSGMVL